MLRSFIDSSIMDLMAAITRRNMDNCNIHTAQVTSLLTKEELQQYSDPVSPLTLMVWRSGKKIICMIRKNSKTCIVLCQLGIVLWQLE